jgi:hypothetical protein
LEEQTMSNSMRWRYGDTNPVVMEVNSSDEIEIGDLLYVASDKAKPASALADAGTLAGNQEAFHDVFVGVAMQASPVGSTTPIRVATSGVFEFATASATYEVGDLVGADEDGSGSELDDQQVIAVAAVNLAIGRCVKRVATAGTKVLVDIASTLLTGGAQAAA